MNNDKYNSVEDLLSAALGKTVAAPIIKSIAEESDMKTRYSKAVMAIVNPLCCEACRLVAEGPIDASTLGRFDRSLMYVCAECGNKRCPRLRWHGYQCCCSNEADQTPVRI